MKSKKQLLNNIIGQLNGVSKMLEEEKECFKTLVQIKAARSALDSLTNKFLQENFKQCLKDCKKREETDELCDKFFKEILKNN